MGASKPSADQATTSECGRPVDKRFTEALNVIHISANVIIAAARLYQSPFIGEKNDLIHRILQNGRTIDEKVVELGLLQEETLLCSGTEE